MHFQWILTCFRQDFDLQWPQILSGHKLGSGFNIVPAINRSRLIFMDFWACVFRPTWVRLCLFSRRVILQISIVNHIGWAWPIQLQFWKGSSSDFSDVYSLQRMQKMHLYKTVSLSSNCRLREKVTTMVLVTLRWKQSTRVKTQTITFQKWFYLSLKKVYSRGYTCTLNEENGLT
jgi:hypothetical protein